VELAGARWRMAEVRASFIEAFGGGGCHDLPPCWVGGASRRFGGSSLTAPSRARALG
jgi:hypothetical protein